MVDQPIQCVGHFRLQTMLKKQNEVDVPELSAELKSLPHWDLER
jgi:hypothetical protein